MVNHASWVSSGDSSDPTGRTWVLVSWVSTSLRASVALRFELVRTDAFIKTHQWLVSRNCESVVDFK